MRALSLLCKKRDMYQGLVVEWREVSKKEVFLEEVKPEVY